MKPTRNRATKPISLYPLKFEDAIADVLKVQPEPNKSQSQAKSKDHKKTARKK